MQRFYQSAAFALFCFVTVSAQAIVIQLDYSYDLNGFFEQAGAKEAMRKAADLFEELITDSLLRIDPDAYFGSGNTFYEAMAMGSPLVTMPGNHMRSRIVAGGYKQMKLKNPPVASNIQEYIDLTIELAKNAEIRVQLKEES